MNVAGWPFAILVDGDVESGASATITIDLAAPMSDDVHAMMEYAIECFVELAARGGLGGDRISPLQSTAGLDPAAPPAAGTRAIWRLTTLAIDARGLVVLFDMLAMLVDGVRAVVVQTSGMGPRVPLNRDELPPMWPQVPFGLEDDRTDPNVELALELARPPRDEAEAELVMDTLCAWLDCGSVQGYRDWYEGPDDGFLEPTAEPPFEIDGTDVIGHLRDSGALEAAYDILINVLVKLHATVPVHVLELV